jgi:hypothetical protein
MRPSPHRCQTWYQSPHGQRVWVVPALVTAEAADRGWRSYLCLHVVLKVDDPIGLNIHLLMSDVEQHTGVVPPMLDLTKSTVSDLQLAVLLCRWVRTAVEDGILMPQPLELT